MTKLLLHYDFLNKNNIDFNKKIIRDLSNDVNDGQFSNDIEWDEKKGVKVDGLQWLTTNNIIKDPTKSYSIEMDMVRLPGNFSSASRYMTLLSTRQNDSYDGIFFYWYTASDSGSYTTLWYWSKKHDLSGSSDRYNMPHKLNEENPVKMRLHIDNTAKTLTMFDAVSKIPAAPKSVSSPGPSYFINPKMRFNKDESGSFMIGYYKSIKIYEGIIDFDKFGISLLMDDNGDLYTINANGNLEIVANINNATKDIIVEHGKDLPILKSALSKWSKDRFKIITMEVK